jgi:hypothetical protein
VQEYKEMPKIDFWGEFFGFFSQKTPDFPKNEIKKCQKYVFGQFLAEF